MDSNLTATSSPLVILIPRQMSPKDPEPIFRTNRYLPPTTNSDRQLTVALAILDGLYSHKSLAKTEQELSQGRSSQTWLLASKIVRWDLCKLVIFLAFFLITNEKWMVKGQNKGHKADENGLNWWQKVTQFKLLQSLSSQLAAILQSSVPCSLSFFLHLIFVNKLLTEKVKNDSRKENAPKAKKPNDNDSVIRQVIVKKTNGGQKRQKH